MSTVIREKDRAAILSSLGAGVVPAVGLQHIQVGRKAEVNALLSDLQRVEAGAAAVRFVVGRFGAGKSFFMNLVQTVALERRFVVAKADITTDRRLNGSGGVARSLYTELTKNLSTRSKPEGGALGPLVERWVSDVSHKVTTAGGGAREVEAGIVERLKPLQDLVSGYDFASVLNAYYKGFAEHKPELQQAAVRWLRGEYATKSEARTDLGVRSIIDDDSFYDYLKLLAAFVRLAGYKGLLVCLDELVVLSHRLNNSIARDRNYEAVLRILNDCLQGSVSGLAVIFAATDDCLTDKRRGLFSYEALATRLAANRFAAGGMVDLSGPVITLSNLTPEDCFVLLVNIRRVFARGQNETSLLPDAAIEAYLESCHKRMGATYFQTPRETIKDFIGLLNVLEQNPSADWRALIGKITTTQTSKPEVVVPDEDAPATTGPAERGRAGSGPGVRGGSGAGGGGPGDPGLGKDDDLASFKL